MNTRYCKTLYYRNILNNLKNKVDLYDIQQTVEYLSDLEDDYNKIITLKAILSIIKTGKEYKQYKNDKDERFSFITKDLPESVKALIEYAPNVSDELDELERQGISLERIKGALEDTDFTNAYKVGGLFMSVLRGLRVSLAPIVEKPIEVFEPRKCDVCKSGCVFGNSLAEFEQGARCELATATEYRITKQRNGLEP